VTIAGSDINWEDTEFNGDGGKATEAKLLKPKGIAIDNNNNLFIADMGADRVRKVTFSNSTEPLSRAAEPYVHDCAYEESKYVASDSGVSEIHIFGVYETRNDHGFDYHPQGTADVAIERQGKPLVLVLSAYEPTKWRLHIDVGVIIEKIILNGYHKQELENADDIVIIDRSGEGNYISSCARKWPSSTGGCDTPRLISGVEALIGTKISSFSGCYRATKFTLPSYGSIEHPIVDKVDAVNPVVSQSIYQNGDTIKITIPATATAPVEQSQYFGVGLPENLGIFLADDLNQFHPFDGISLLEWRGGKTAVDIPVTQDLPRGTYNRVVPK